MYINYLSNSQIIFRPIQNPIQTQEISSNFPIRISKKPHILPKPLTYIGTETTFPCTISLWHALPQSLSVVRLWEIFSQSRANLWKTSSSSEWSFTKEFFSPPRNILSFPASSPSRPRPSAPRCSSSNLSKDQVQNYANGVRFVVRKTLFTARTLCRIVGSVADSDCGSARSPQREFRNR